MPRITLRPAAALLAALTLALAGCSNGGSFSRARDQTWVDVARWRGDGWKTTEAVEVDSREWRLVVTGRSLAPGDGQWIWINIHDDGGDVVGRASINSERSDTTYVHNRDGIFYFEVQQRLLMWEIAVQVPRSPAEEQDSP